MTRAVFALQRAIHLLHCKKFIETHRLDPKAFSQARYKISYTGFKALHEEMLADYYTKNNEGLWKGFWIFGVDGSTCRLLDKKNAPE